MWTNVNIWVICPRCRDRAANSATANALISVRGITEGLVTCCLKN